ncbi:sensor histidine kinase [Paenibacillus hexagrammi]|uniref:histidine kinase n=1 Tax=Paenibacillus hexagrammi TaxID=2908839 RepID=A0ABY3SGV8_9BACL|nr:sensor histidine kinase [Paenibacillus sp. YPD9-1]UJF32640.1 sensor histidine kinase [Paenibacillus sp. YPD9-1]
MNFKSVEPNEQLDDKVIDYLTHTSESSGTFSFIKPHGKRVFVVFDTLKVNQWKVVAVYPESDLLNKLSSTKYLFLAITLLVILIAVLLSNLLAKVLTKPLATLTRKVYKVESGNLDVDFDVDVHNEIGVLNRSIGRLVKSVSRLLEEIKVEQEHKRVAEFDAMQAQIKPHFLYNTLFAIKQLVDLKDNEAASDMVLALSNFYRTSLSSGQEVITVEEEIDLIRNYFVILSMRYGDSFHYEISIDPEIAPSKVIKLILQPVVENAIYHGVKETEDWSLIQITGYRDLQDIVFEISDDGAGIPADKLAEIKAKLNKTDIVKGRHGFGMFNVHNRLQTHYGSRYGLDIESEWGKGTVVRIRVPIVL